MRATLGGRHDHGTDRRHWRRQVRGWTAADCSSGRIDDYRQYRRRHGVVGIVRFARSRFHHLHAGWETEPGARLGREGRHFFLPECHGPDGTTDMVSRRRSRSGHAHFSIQVAGRRQDAQRSHVRDREQAWSQGACPAHEQFARGDAGFDSGGRLEL